MCSMMKRTIEIREEGVPEAFAVVRKSWEEGGVRFLSWSFRAGRTADVGLGSTYADGAL